MLRVVRTNCGLCSGNSQFQFVIIVREYRRDLLKRKSVGATLIAFPSIDDIRQTYRPRRKIDRCTGVLLIYLHRSVHLQATIRHRIEHGGVDILASLHLLGGRQALRGIVTHRYAANDRADRGKGRRACGKQRHGRKRLMSTPEPPRAVESVPAHPAVMLEACSKAVAGVPPSVRVTLVSLVLVSAAGVTTPPARGWTWSSRAYLVCNTDRTAAAFNQRCRVAAAGSADTAARDVSVG